MRAAAAFSAPPPPPAAPAPWVNPLAAGGADAAVTQLLMEADLKTRPGFAPQPPPQSGFGYAPAPPTGGFAPAPPNPRSPRGGERRPPGHSGPYRRN